MYNNSNGAATNGGAPGYAHPAMQSVHSRYVGYDAVNNAPVSYQPSPPAYSGPPPASLTATTAPTANNNTASVVYPTPPSATISVVPPPVAPSIPVYGAPVIEVTPPPLQSTATATAMNIFDPATDVVSLNPNSRSVL